MSYPYLAPSCFKTIKLDDYTSVKEMEKKPTPAETFDMTFSHQTAAMLANLTSFLRTINASVTQKKFIYQRVSSDLRDQKKTLKDIENNFSVLSQIQMMKNLKGNVNYSKRPMPEGMYS